MAPDIRRFPVLLPASPWLAVAGFALWSSPAQAQALGCSVSADAIVFGTIETLGSGYQNSAGEVTVTCVDPAAAPIACLKVVGRPDMSSGSGQIPYLLADTDAGTGEYSGVYSSPVTLTDNGGTWSATFPIHAIVSRSLPDVPVGIYGGDADIVVGVSDTGATDCAGALTLEESGIVSLEGQVVEDCNIGVTDIDFGSVGLLDAPVTSIGTVSGRCTPGTSYTINLDDGLQPVVAGGARRMKSERDDYLEYDLYKDDGHAERWGSGSDGLAAEVLEGGSDGYSHTIHARLPPQPASAGQYSDTVIATIVYGE